MLLQLVQDTKVDLGHPFRVPLPHYGVVAEDPIGKTMIVDVPDAELPPEILADEGRRDVDTYRGPVAVHHSRKALDAWHAHLDKHYQEHAGRFRPHFN